MTEITPALRLSAYILGRRIAGQRKRTPVAYLYNGVRLPKLPEWDREKYPYVFIVHPWLESLGYRAVALQEPAFVSDGVIYFEYPWLRTICDEETGWDGWREMGEGAETNIVLHSSRNAWSNYDILNENGTLYLAATTPIPVYE